MTPTPESAELLDRTFLARVIKAAMTGAHTGKIIPPEEIGFAEIYDRHFLVAADAVLARLAAKPADEVREARAEDIAIELCLVDGHNPDDEAPRTVMCDGDNMPVPWWMVYTEYAETLIEKFHVIRRALSTGEPKP